MAAMLGDVRTLTLLEAPLAHLLLGPLLPSHCGLKELPRVERRAPLLTALAEHLRSCNPRPCQMRPTFVMWSAESFRGIIAI